MKNSATRAFSRLSGNKKSLFRLLVFSAALLLFGETRAQTTYYVNDAFTAGDKFCTAVGNNANSGLSPASPKFSVNDAMALAASGDRILIDNGEYLISSLVVSNGVKLVGADPDNTILRVQAAGAPIQLASNSELWNCKIFRAIPGAAGNPPTISVANQAGASNVRIENCFFYKNRTAIYLNWGDNITIARNRFDDNRTSIIVDVLGGTNYNDLVIRDNEIKNSRSYGIIMFGPAEGAHTGYVKATIENNIITGNLAGGIEYNNTNASSLVKLRNNWFGVAPGSVDVNNMRTNGGFNVADHDGTGLNNPSFTDNGTLIGASYPNDLSGGNVSALTIATHASSAPMGAGPTLFVKSSNPAFDYYTNVQDAINNSNATATITIPNGTFREDVNVNKALHVTGTTQAGTILKGLYYTSNANSVEISANGASVNYLTVTRDFGTTPGEWAAATKNQGLVINANNDTVNNVLITGNRNGLYINNRQGFVVTNNNIEQNRTGIQMGNNISNGRITNNKINGNFTHGVMLNADLGAVNATGLTIKNNEIKDNWYTQIYLQGANTITSSNTSITCNSYGTNQPTTINTAAGEPGYAAQTPAQFGGTAPATFATFAGTQIAATPTAPWLDNAVDAQAGISGFQRATSITVAPVSGPLSAVNNDYRILANAIGCVETGNTVTINGLFDWNTTEAKAAWALGNNGVTEGSTAAAATGSGDDYSISVPDANNVTLTSATVGGATIQGPGDLSNVALESAIYFNSNKPNSNFKNWTISKIKFNALDVAVIADHNGGPLDVMEGLTLTNNEFSIPSDLNTTVAPADNFQNIGVHLNYGKNQTISNNKFIIDGTGVSDSANLKYSTSVALQSATGGGDEYNKLKLQNNEVHVTGVPNANPARVVGFWENSNNQNSAIDISGNTFVNDAAGNLAGSNNQLALRITSFSGDASHQVVYQNNEITGFNRAFDFLGDPFSQYTPNAFYATANPVIIKNNKVQDSKYGVTVRKDAASANTGSPAIVNNNSFKGITAGGYAIANLGTGANTDATCNYLDSPMVQPAANVTFLPRLNSGNDVSPAVKGFQPAPNTCIFPVHNITQNLTYATIQAAVNAANANDTIQVGVGTYNERVTVDKALTIQGDTLYTQSAIVMDGTGLSGTGSGITLNNGIQNVTIKNLTIKNYAGLNPNSSAGIKGVSNNNLKIKRVDVSDNSGGSGIFLSGPINNVWIDSVRATNHSNVNGAARGIVIWDALKTNIKIENCVVSNNNCCGIELQDGTASGVIIRNNTISGVDNGIGVVGLQAGSGPSIIENNNVTITNGRFGIEIKNPNGTGIDNDTANGAIIVRGNIVNLASTTDARDLAGIAVMRRGWQPGNANIPTGVVVKGNTVSGFVQTSNSTGFGIVVEGINHKVLNNVVSGNDVGIQRQAGHTPYTANAIGDGDQSNLADAYFGRGNSPVSCSIEVTGNTPNTVTDVMYSGNRMVKNVNNGLPFCTISDAVADAGTVNSHVLEVQGTDAFNETVNVNKQLTIRGVGASRPILDFSGTLAPGSKPALFTVSAPNVTIDSLDMRVDFAKVVSAILTNGDASNLHINKNKILAYRSVAAYAAGFTAYGLRNAISINAASGNSPGATQITSGFDGVVVKSNEITGTPTGLTPAFWRAGIHNDLCGIIVGGNTAAEGNTITSINHDVLVRFQNQGVTTIKNNTFNGGGVQYAEPNAGGGAVTIEQNTFNYQLGTLLTGLVRLQNNVSNKTVLVKNNTFSGHNWYISMENFKNATIDGNTFTPAAAATAFRHITVNTKLLASTALNDIVRQTIDATIINNIFNGSATATNGKGIAFYNHWNNGSGAQYGDFIVGQPGAMNTFNDGITNYIFIDSLNGISTNTLNTDYPEYAGAGSQNSATGYWTKDVNGINNLYAASVAGTPKHFSAMDFNERYNYLYGHIYDKADNVNIGRVLFETPVHNITHPSDYASIQEAIDAAVTLDGDTIVADAGLYREHLNINKNNLVIRGANAGTSGNNLVRVSESVLSAKTASLTQSLINLPSGRTVTFDGFTISNAEQIMANTSGSNTMTMKNNIIKDITSSQNTSGHNFYWAGGSLTLDSNKVVFSGLNTDNNGGKSHFFIAGGSMSAKGNTFSSSALVTPTMGTTSRPVMFNLTSTLNQASIYNNVFDSFGLGMLIAAQASNLDIYQNDFRNAVEPSSVTAGAAIAFYEGFAPTGLINIHNNNFENSSNGIRTSGSAATAFPGSNLLRIRNNKFSGMTNAAIVVGASFTGNLDALCNSFGTATPFAPDMTATGNVVTVLGTANVNYRNWLVYGDNAPATLGFQAKTQYTVASNGNTTANNNDYRILSNAVGCAVKGDVITLNGSFTFNNANAQFEWEKGNDGNLATTADNWSVVLPLDVDSVTLTGINNATVNGPGDIAAANLEAFLVANSGHNAKWNINNLTIKDIDMAIAFQSTATGAADSLQLHHNTIYIPKDLNAQVAPADVNQNIGIILANGKGQRISNNTVYVDATGISNGFAQKSTSVVLQSTTTGGTMYDGLKINDNTIHVTGVPDADTSKTAYVLGIWENGHNKNADIQIYNNKFLNDNAGNLSANNRQLAFRVTSRSGAAKLVTYNHNEITGFNRGIEWIGDPFSTYGPYAYEADAMPVEIKNNLISNVQYGVSVRKDNASPNANAPAYINNNSFTSIGQKAIVYTATTGTVDASCNYFDAADINQVVDGNVSFGLYLNSGANVAVIGFEPAPATTCIGRVHNVTQNTWYPTIQSAIDHPTTVDNDVIVASPGTYAEDVVVNKSLDIRGNNYGISPNTGTRIAESIIVPATSDIQNGVVVSVEKKKVSISGFTIDGDNTKVNSGFAGVNGADLNTAEAIAVYTDNIDSLTVKNNIIKNTSYMGVTLYGTSANAPATTGNLVDSNLIKDLGTYSVASGIANWGGGVLLYNSQYTRVTNNVMDNVRVGLQTGNFHYANPGSALYQVASGNTINARRRGVFHNLQTVNASPYTISNNTINAVANVNEVAVWDGILAASLSTPSNLTANIINGNAAGVPSRGVQVWNVKNTTPVNLSGGTVSNVDIGIYANNYDGYNSDGTDGASVNVSSITISPKVAGTGMRIADNAASTAHAPVSLTVNSGVVISGGAKGVIVENGNASATLNTLTLNGQVSKYIELAANANNIDATAVTFDGVTGATATLNQNYIIEDKIVHKIDEEVLGFVKVKDLNTFVTPFSFTANTVTPKVQRGVNAASAGWTENVQNGTYTENVIVNKALTIIGGGSATTKINPATTNGNTITIAANNVTIQDLHVEGVPVSGSSATRGIYMNSTISGAKLENIKSTLHQYAVYADNAANVDGLTVTNSELSNSGNGLGIEAQAKVSKLYVSGGTISNNLYGISSTANSAVTNNQAGLTRVSVTNVSFTGNQIKGMYFEKLDSAKISNNTLTGNGTSPGSPSGIDVNLKFGTYANIVLAENALTGNGTGAVSGNGMTVKARNDGAYSTNVATLTGLTINNNEVSGSPVGIAVGNNVTASSMNFENNLISGASRGVVIYGMTNGSVTTLYHNSISASPTTIENGDGNASTVTATCNWLGSANAATIASSIIGTVAYNPWLLNGTDASVNRGFQTTAPCNNRPTSVLTLTGDDTLCYGNSTTLSIALTGTAPWTVTYTDGTTPVTQSGVMTSPLVINVTPLVNTTYSVTALNDADYPALASDMTGSATVYVTVAPVPSISYATPFCKLSTGEAVTLTGTGAYTGGTFSAPAALSINPVTGTINPSTSTPGTYLVSYTTLASGGCPAAMAQTSVVVKNSWTANISGTTTVAQNISTTANISFSATGTGGKAPYTFNYSVSNGTTTTTASVTTSGTNTVVTVPQSNAVAGQFIYTLLSATDSAGCPALLAADVKDTITVTAGGGTVDLTPIIVVSNPSFTNTVTTRPYTLNIFNVGNAPSSGTIGIYIIKPNSGSTLTFDPAWTVSESPSYYYIESSTQTINGNFGSISLPGTITVAPSVAPSNFSLQVILAPGAGGDSVSGNNAKAVNLSKTN